MSAVPSLIRVKEMEQIMGDIGERRRHIELEPVEVPVQVPSEEPVPAGRFWAGVGRGERDECWPWLRHLDPDGYGRMRVGGSMVRAHRIAYVKGKGAIPTGMTIDHLCRNRACCNPSHLEAVTRAVNTLRGEGPTAVNARRLQCKHGHPFDKENTYMRPNGARDCRSCIRARVAAYTARKKEVPA